MRLAVTLAVFTLLLATGHPRDARAQSRVPDSAADLDSRIGASLSDIERIEARQARVESEIAGLGERKTAAQRRVVERTRALYRLTRAGMLPLSGGFSALLSHFSRVQRLTRLVREDSHALASLSARGDALRGETSEIAASLTTARGTLATLQQEKSRLDALDLSPGSWGAAFDTEYQLDSYGAGYGSLRVLDDPSYATRSFRAQRGRLGVPVSGPVDVRPAERDGEGLEFIAPANTGVRAVEEGRVAWADRHGSYGLMVILDHGDGYFTVYASLASTDVRVGDHVSRGARIGVTGDTGLFFQVREGTRSLDAAGWLGL